jgi:hypothetical protein
MYLQSRTAPYSTKTHSAFLLPLRMLPGSFSGGVSYIVSETSVELHHQ